MDEANIGLYQQNFAEGRFYASVKLKCMFVTNDEMKDHIFELLGSNIFSMQKERHQVC